MTSPLCLRAPCSGALSGGPLALQGAWIPVQSPVCMRPPQGALLLRLDMVSLFSEHASAF